MHTNASSLDLESTHSLDHLAAQLALNYLDTSLNLADLEGRRKERIEQVFEPNCVPGLNDVPSRNILVLGAGASLAAFGREAFPGARMAMDELDRRLEGKLGARPPWIEERIANEKQRLQVSYRYDDAPHDFETHLAILSKIYPPQEIANTLAEIYGERYWPHLTFELIAHLLKHRFVDVVINFNFDELLDQAIEEELGRSQYHHIISDGHCHSLRSVMVGNRLKAPIHIKPHGTARHRSTLRFTKEQYFTLPDAMRRFMQNLIAGFTEDDGSGKRYRTNLISVGFAMRSVDLIQMLRFAVDHENDLAIYHVNTADWRDNIEVLKGETGVRSQHFIDANYSSNGLHGTLLSLVERISEHFREPYRPRGVARHKLVHALFFDPGTGRRVPCGGDRRNEIDYHRARLCAELAISLAKGKGRVDIRALVDDRVGIYFDQLRDEAGKVMSKTSTESLATTLGYFQDANYPLRLTGIDHNVLSAGYPAELQSSAQGEWLWSALRSAFGLMKNEEIQARIRYFRENPEKSDEIARLFQSLVDADARDINANFLHRHLLLSSEPNADEVIHTNLGFTLKFADLVRSDWDVMLAISEYGRVLDKLELMNSGSLARRRYCLVLARTDQEAETAARLDRFRGHLHRRDALEDYQLPFWLHNHHMVVVMKRTHRPRVWDFRGGIRYDRHGLSNRINPVYLDALDKDDLDRLVDSFFGYVWQANNSDWQTWSDSEIREQVKATREDLLSKWWRELTEAA